MQPIGVFDSGVGGLTVLRALRETLPAESFVYLGDTARLPYGTKSADTVARYSLQCAAALMSRGIRCLVVACNTASASALDALRARYPNTPVIGVIEPGARAAVSASTTQHIAVIGTEGTIAGGAYQAAIHRLNPDARVVSTACSLFVAMAEEGWTTGPIVEAVALRYLEPLFWRGGSIPDTLVLGCTHFPALLAAIRRALPATVRIVDSAHTTAATVARHLARAPSSGTDPCELRAVPTGTVTWLATDGAERFAHASSTFLGERIQATDIAIIDL